MIVHVFLEVNKDSAKKYISVYMLLFLVGLNFFFLFFLIEQSDFFVKSCRDIDFILVYCKVENDSNTL